MDKTSPILLAGLGNPGPQYAKNRHNAGFMAVDEIADTHHFSPWREKFEARLCEGEVEGRKFIALKPLTFMNLSGQAVGAAARFYKIPPGHVVVFHDDLDLLPGKIRIKKGGGNGGHNGLRSIDSHIGPDYWRVRIGIGHPGHRDLVHNWVLQDFSRADADWLEPLFSALSQEFPFLAKGDANGYMSRIALRVSSLRNEVRL